MPKEINRDSTDNFVIPVTVLIASMANPDITTDAVYFAFLPANEPNLRPQGSDWDPGFWGEQGGVPAAAITVGPDGTTNPGFGRWNGWIWLVDSPTQPKAMVDLLIIS